MAEPFEIATRPAEPGDADAIERLLPRLAAFDPLPPGRDRDDLWRPDLVGLRAWASGEQLDTSVRVASLDGVVVDSSVDGRGVGQELMAELDAEARERGAATMSLNVFTANDRARAPYARLGFHEEMIRAVRPLT